MQEALQKKEYWRLRDGSGKPPGVIGWWPAHGVTFLDNHDTGSTQQHWPFPTEHLQEVSRPRSCSFLLARNLKLSIDEEVEAH